MSRYWSAVVRGLTPYVPGEQPKLPNLVKLNTNENPYGPSPKVLEALLAETGDTLRLYPDPNADSGSDFYAGADFYAGTDGHDSANSDPGSGESRRSPGNSAGDGI